MVDSAFYESDTGDPKLEELAASLAEAAGIPIARARVIVDVNPSTQALLGRQEPREVPHAAVSLLEEYLKEIRRLAENEKVFKIERERLSGMAQPLLEAVGSHMLIDPIDGKKKIANIRAAETLQVDAGELYDALMEQTGDEDEAEAIWRDTLKPPAVDTADGGRFHQQCVPPEDEPDKEPRISSATVAKVARYKKAKAFIGFSKVDG